MPEKSGGSKAGWPETMTARSCFRFTSDVLARSMRYKKVSFVKLYVSVYSVIFRHRRPAARGGGARHFFHKLFPRLSGIPSFFCPQMDASVVIRTKSCHPEKSVLCLNGLPIVSRRQMEASCIGMPFGVQQGAGRLSIGIRAVRRMACAEMNIKVGIPLNREPKNSILPAFRRVMLRDRHFSLMLLGRVHGETALVRLRRAVLGADHSRMPADGLAGGVEGDDPFGFMCQLRGFRIVIKHKMKRFQ